MINSKDLVRSAEDEDKIHVSILGVCVLRDIFGICDDNEQYVVDRFVQSVNPVSAIGKSPLKKRFTLAEAKDVMSSASDFYKRNAVLDLNKTVFDYFKEIRSKYLLLDIACLREPMLRFRGTGENQDLYVTKPLVKKHPVLFEQGYLDHDAETRNCIDMEVEEIHYCLDQYIEKILAMYDETDIILVEIRAVNWFTNGNGSHVYLDRVSIVEDFNQIFDIGFSYIRRRLPRCHVIEFPANVVGNERHKWKKGVLHYVNEYYDYAYKAMGIISQNLDPIHEKLEIEKLRSRCANLCRERYKDGKGKFAGRIVLLERCRQYEIYFRRLIADGGQKKLEEYVERNRIHSAAFYGYNEASKALIPALASVGVKCDYIVEDRDVNGFIVIPRCTSIFPDTECMFIMDLRVASIRKKLLDLKVSFHVSDLYEIIGQQPFLDIRKCF